MSKGFSLKEEPDGTFKLLFDGAQVDVGLPEIEDGYTARAYLRTLAPPSGERVRTRRIPGRLTRALDALRSRANL